MAGSNNHFYVTLPSNTASHPDNKTNEFTVRLARRIQLDGEWEVALAEIIYPHTWFNVDGEADHWVEMVMNDDCVVKCQMPANQYESPGDLASGITQLVDEELDRQQHRYDNQMPEVEVSDDAIHSDELGFSVKFDNARRRMVMKLAKPSLVKSIKMSGALRHVLGFEEIKTVAENTVAKYPVDLKGGFNAMYIYCDILPNLMVGDILAPLLRVVNVEGRHDEIICKVYNTMHYVPLAKRELDTIQISIKDDAGRPVRFQDGKVVIKLHFRRQRFFL
jgi:hypothetical protein